jgi:predicted site-specific integrase-resolvase
VTYDRKTNLKAKAKTPAETRRLGYARVSTYGQTLDAQLEQLRADGCVEIYYEKVSGARTDRGELLKLLKALTPGDVVIVTRIDRLARSIFDLFAIVKQIVEAGEGARAALGAPPETHRRAEGGSPPSPRRRGDAQGTGADL